MSGFHPLIVVFNRLLSLFLIYIAQVAFSVHHDQVVIDALAFGNIFEFPEVFFVPGLALIKGVDVFHGVNAKLLLGNSWEIDRVHFPVEEGPVQRPLGQGNVKKHVLFLAFCK